MTHSLGCVVLECATGKRPWSELDNEWAIMCVGLLLSSLVPLRDFAQVPDWYRCEAASSTRRDAALCAWHRLHQVRHASSYQSKSKPDLTHRQCLIIDANERPTAAKLRDSDPWILEFEDQMARDYAEVRLLSPFAFIIVINARLHRRSPTKAASARLPAYRRPTSSLLRLCRACRSRRPSPTSLEAHCRPSARRAKSDRPLLLLFSLYSRLLSHCTLCTRSELELSCARSCLDLGRLAALDQGLDLFEQPRRHGQPALLHLRLLLPFPRCFYLSSSNDHHDEKRCALQRLGSSLQSSFRRRSLCLSLSTISKERFTTGSRHRSNDTALSSSTHQTTTKAR